MSEPLSRGPSVWRRFTRHRAAAASLAWFALVALACLLAPALAPYPFDGIDLDSVRQPPSPSHWMGTDDLGRDVLTRMLFGGRVSILIGILAALLGTLLGTAIGASAGYYGGILDGILMRITDVAYAIPTLPLLIVLSAYSRAALPSMVLIIGFLSWMTTARVVRSQVLTIKEMDYVEAARSMGATDWRILSRHIVPNALGPILVGATLGIANAIMIESSLSFLGLGVQPPIPTWGNMLMDSQATMATKPWLMLFPGLAILLIVLAVNFMGRGLSDALDPGDPGLERLPE
ncbi:MAG: ABC transporter permease [Vicinamibacteria bacterium]|nr:ABC transporter permease [Vicinamibacteria bacterium]